MNPFHNGFKFRDKTKYNIFVIKTFVNTYKSRVSFVFERNELKQKPRSGVFKMEMIKSLISE